MKALPAVLIFAFAASAGAQQRDSALILAAKRVSVTSLDSAVRGGTLRDWMTALAALARQPAPAVTWEVNDCGEGGDGRKAPTCVEASFTAAQGTRIGVSVIVAGLDGKPGAVQTFMLTAKKGDKVDFFKTLHELERFVRSLVTPPRRTVDGGGVPLARAVAVR